MEQQVDKYFEELNEKVNISYNVARRARSKSYDPTDYVEIPLAKNMAERVERLIGVVSPQIVGKGMSQRIEELEKEYGKLDWRVALKIALEVTNEKFCKFENTKEAIEIGIRVGFAYATVGVVASPLEGFTGVEIRKRRDGKEYLALFYSGPVRSAGGTAASVSVLIADYIRKQKGFHPYDADETEIKRTMTEVRDYHERVTNLQYFPEQEEMNYLASKLPVQIDGDPTEKFEVSNYKNLDRIKTNRIRGGFCLVMAECIAQKSKKLLKQLNEWGKDFELDDWFFMEKFCKLQTKLKSKKKEEKYTGKVSPDYTFIKDIVAGRPVLTYPLEKGGFRLRYGRARNTGLSSTAIHPITMKLLNDYIAIGTQLKTERPGKGTAVGCCDSLEGPIVKLKDGSVVFLDENNFDKYKPFVAEILFLGDLLISYGDFLNRAHQLIPPGYCEEWWLKHIQAKSSSVAEVSKLTNLNISLLKKIFDDPINTKISASNAFQISNSLKIPFHPKYTFHWKELTIEKFIVLIGWLAKSVIKKEDNYKIILPLDYVSDVNIKPKRILEILGIPHKVVTKEHVVISGEWAISLMANLGFYQKDIDFVNVLEKVDESKTVLEFINTISEVTIKDKSGISVGARMGRPEKAKMRKMPTSPHVLFPVGREGGRLRSFQSALDNNKIKAEFPIFFCKKCEEESIYTYCWDCKCKTIKKYYCFKCKKIQDRKNCVFHGICSDYSTRDVDVSKYFNLAKKQLGLKEIPNLIKGVRNVSNKDKSVENLSKGFLRSIHNLSVNKDGTIRYDMTELPLTHFVPGDTETSLSKLKELGYEKDIYGEKLISLNQVLCLKPQDIILPSCPEASEEGSDNILYRVSKFVDDLLFHFYGLDKFYNLKSKEDLIGHLVISLAPHTSAGVIGRIIGFSKTQGCYASPVWHCAQRRDCDGDECGVMLLMDGLLNFSRKYLPGHRGATQDAPLVLTSNIILTEVDDMVFDMDCAWEYPLEFYEACEKYKMPWDVKIEIVGNNLKGKGLYTEMGFTHKTRNINQGVRYSAYKKIPTMEAKVLGQMELGRLIRAVDENDVARLVIDRHFIRDIKGNLRKFSMQQFRCVDCNEKFRRVPLIGKCLKCGGKLLFTISEGSVTKYLTPSLRLAKNFDLPSYTFQMLNLTKKRIESVFGKLKDRQEGLVRWVD